jgi:myo-inositol-1(or 4)-monophosphatase
VTFAHDRRGPLPEQERGTPAPGPHALLAHLRGAARDAAAFIRDRASGRAELEWRAKSPTDFVSAVDTGAEARIAAWLGREADGIPRELPVTILAEEASPDATPGPGITYVIDPLDGTTNFLHGFPWYAVSIAALLDGVPVAGVVLNVANGELFAATRGGGATRDGAPIRVSTIDDPARALLGTGFPFRDAAHVGPYLAALPAIMTATAGLRRAGSAALDLCDVACGRFEGFWELRLGPWDFAAGALIATEAGALVTDMRGAPLETRHSSVLAANPSMHAWLRERLKPALAAAS